MFTLFSALLVFLSGCNPVPDQVIMTVRGPEPASAMGITLTHEHVLVDFIGADSTGYHRWDRDDAVIKVLPYLEEIKEYGVETFIECTPAFVGRDPNLLRTLSRKSGLNIITNTGYYGAHENKFLPEVFHGMEAGELAELWIREFEEGIEGSDIRPGFIKIAVAPADTLPEEHVKIVAAAALAHNRTGLVIASHTGPDAPAFQQIDILQSYGVVPSSFIWVHAQHGTLEGNLKAAREGAWISLDNVNDRIGPGERYSVDWYADRIAAIKKAGGLKKVLVSHDAGWYSPGEDEGGDFRGYTAIFTSLVPALEERGVSQEEIRQLLEHNPREAFKLRKPL